jgi:phosphohistidine swiveling domain-containing protein
VRRVYALDDPRVLDPAVAGAKAATLARARRAGLPVLAGWVVPVAVATSALRFGADALAERGGPAAVLRVAGMPLDDELVRDLRDVGRRLGGPAIVRSSSLLDLDPRWAGAFETYADVSADDVPTAVRGCWASAFSRAVLSRCEALRMAPDRLRIAVVIQPWVRFDHGGTATALDDGTVDVAWTSGRPSDLLSGRSVGTTARVGPNGEIGTADGGRLVARIARLAHDARDATGESSIEWGSAGGDAALLQVRRAPALRRAVTAAVSSRLPRLPDVAERLAAVVSTYPAPLGDRLVVPWAVAFEELPAPAPIDVADPAAAMATVLVVASELTAVAWGLPPDVASAEAERVLRAVRGERAIEAFGRLGRVRPVDPAAAGRVLGLVDGMGRALALRGALTRSGLVCRLTDLEVRRAAEGGAPAPERLGASSWEPFVADVVFRNGRERIGRGAASGVGAGWVHVPARWTSLSSPPQRAVIAVDEPLPRFAPLLWGAAALVSRGGNAEAHLFHVARSLGVPSVAGVGLATSDGSLAAVDGDRGAVAVLGRAPS